MSTYLEIDSTYRDRILYPNPFDFTLKSENISNRDTSERSINPISDAYPIYNFQGPHPELLGINKNINGDDTQNKYSSTLNSRFGGTGVENQFSINHDGNFAIDSTNPWTITTNIGVNSYGPGNSSIPNLDGVPIDKIGSGYASNKTIINENKTLYPNQYEYDFLSANSYNTYPYSSSVDKYYNNLYLSRYDNSTTTTNNPSETIKIYDFKGANKLYRNENTNNIMYYNDGTTNQTIQSNDIDTSQILFSKGPNSCLLEKQFSKWTCDDFWTVNNGSMLSVSNPHEIFIHNGSDINNFYKDYYIEDCTLPIGLLEDSEGNSINLSNFENRFKKILRYNSEDKKAIISDKNTYNPFPISTYTSGYCKLITDNNYSKMNINPDRANSFTINMDSNSLLSNLSSINGFSSDGTQYTWAGNDKNGAKGWIPQDRYRIRKELPLVMGWGVNEDRDGSHVRKGGKTNSSEVDQNELYSGTGPRNGVNTAVYDFTIIDNGKDFLTTYVYGTGNTINDLYIEIIEVDSNDNSIKECRIVWPGSGFSVGDEVTIINKNNNTNAILKIEILCQTIDISNGFNGQTTGILSEVYGEYDNQLLYIPSKGPEKESSQYSTKYHLTGYLKTVKPYSKGKDPPFINQFPHRIDNNNFTSDDTGIVQINRYVTCTKQLLYQNNTTSNWIVNNNSIQKCAVILTLSGYSNPVTGNIANGTNSNKGIQTIYNFNNKLIPINGYNRVNLQNSYNWEILNYNRDGVKSIKYPGDSNTNYEHIFISLDSIVIPNVLLKTYLADKTIFNSYFYVELKNTDSDIKNKIFGNSIVNSALFKVSTDNIPDLDKLNFCRLFGDGMEQKFQINEKKDISFKLLLSNGDVCIPDLSDITPPANPDKNLQISALFKIRKS